MGGEQADLSKEDIEAEFPEWHVYRSVTGQWWYARRPNTSPPLQVRAGDLPELRQRIQTEAERLARLAGPGGDQGPAPVPDPKP